MSLETCFSSIREYTQENDIKVSESDLRWFATKMDAALRENSSKAEMAAKMMSLVDEKMVQESLENRASNLMDLAKAQAVRDDFKINTKLGISIFEHIRNFVEGGALKGGFGTNLDPLLSMQYFRDTLTAMLAKLEPIKSAIRQGGLDLQFHQELWALENGLKTGLSGSPEAVQFAKVIHEMNEYSSSLKKQMNPKFNKTDNFLYTQDHNFEKIFGSGTDAERALNKQAWLDFHMTRARGSFPDLSPVERLERFKSIYDEITSGDYGSSYGKGSGGIRERMAQSRTIIYDDYKARNDYNRQWGSGTAFDAVLNSIDRDARQIALLEKYGGSPDKLLETLIRNGLADAPNAKEKAELDRNTTYLENSLKTALGQTNKAPAWWLPRVVQGAMTYTRWASTARSVLSAGPDFSIAANTVRNTMGQNIGEVTKNLIGYSAKMLSPTERAIYARAMGVMSNTYLKSMAGEFGTLPTAEGGLKGAIQGGVQFMNQNWDTINGHNLLHDVQKTSIAATMGDILARDSDIPFKDLGREQQNGALRYKIGPEEWPILKWMKSDVSGEKFVTPQAARTIPDEAIENWMRRTGQLTGEASPKVLDMGRTQMAIRVASLINEHAQMGSVRGGTRQQAFQYGGTDINSGLGMFYRSVWMLKQASLVSTDALRRAYADGDALGSKLANVGRMSGGMVGMAALGYWANQLSLGKTPEEPTTLKFWGTVLAKAGMGGPTADILLDSIEKNGMDQKVLAMAETAAGPLLTRLGEGLALTEQSVQSGVEGKKLPWSQIGQYASSNLPVQAQLNNLVFTAPIWRFYFTNGMREWLSPGYIGRLSQGVNRVPGIGTESGHQEYMLLNPRESHFPWN